MQVKEDVYLKMRGFNRMSEDSEIFEQDIYSLTAKIPIK